MEVIWEFHTPMIREEDACTIPVWKGGKEKQAIEAYFRDGSTWEKFAPITIIEPLENAPGIPS